MESGKVWLEGEYDNIKYMFKKALSWGLEVRGILSWSKRNGILKRNYSGKFKMTVVGFQAEEM